MITNNYYLEDNEYAETNTLMVLVHTHLVDENAQALVHVDNSSDGYGMSKQVLIILQQLCADNQEFKKKFDEQEKQIASLKEAREVDLQTIQSLSEEVKSCNEKLSEAKNKMAKLMEVNAEQDKRIQALEMEMRALEENRNKYLRKLKEAWKQIKERCRKCLSCCCPCCFPKPSSEYEDN